MITARRVLPIPIRYALPVSLLLFFSGVVLSQDAPVVLPNHAAPINYGKGWECKPGFRDAGDSCDPVVVPENAYPTNAMYGTGWKCERGYLESKGECAAIEVPPNGYLTERSYKPGWKCERGYRETDDNCVAIEVPEHGHFINTLVDHAHN